MKRVPSEKPGDAFAATRHSLVERLANWEDQRNWQDFFETYWRLIYGVARKSGLSDAEAQDVVQETVLTVAKNITKYERTAGSFKSWLLHTTRWRIADQFRKRSPADRPRIFPTIASAPPPPSTASPMASIYKAAWNEEWQSNVLAAALERVKRKVDAKHYQIFDCAVIKQWPPAKVAAELQVSSAQVYLVKHRISALVKKEVAAVEKRF